MTLPPEKLGDQGQRYWVVAEGYPQKGSNDVGYSEKYETACALADAIVQAPGCVKAQVVDREDHNEVVWEPRP